SLEIDERPLDQIEDVTELKGIGKGVGEVINEYRETGHSTTLATLQEEVTEGLIPLLKIQGLGSKKKAKKYKELNINGKEAKKKDREKGYSTNLATLKEEEKEELIHILKIQGLGSKKIAKLYKALNIDGKEALQKACEEGKVSELSGFAKKTEQNILEAVKALGAKKERYPIDQMRGLNIEVSDYLSSIESIEKYEVAGSFRRYKEMSKDLDYIISTE